jgi:hypothetical protein
MSGKFILICVLILSFLGFGYFYKSHYYPESALPSDPVAAKRKTCSDVFVQIEALPSCNAKLDEFQKNWKMCQGEHVTYREGLILYNDYYFDLVDCFMHEKNEAKASEVLNLLEKIPPWQHGGPTDCPVSEEARARLESIHFPENTCIKDTDLRSWVGTSPDFSENFLKQMTLKNHSLSFGVFNSDDICFTPISRIASEVEKHRHLVAGDVDSEEHDTRNVFMVDPETGKPQLVIVMGEENGCLFVSGVFTTN